MKDLFPSYFFEYLANCPLEKITELRLRLGKKIVVCLSNKSYYLGTMGLTGDKSKGLNCEKELVDEILRRSCENSVYAYNEQIKNGFITTKGGIRIGFGGEAVYEKRFLKTFKNINSLAIRFPHQVEECSKNILPFLFNNGFLSTLIVSPPGCGKTTLIRDIILQLSNKEYCYNVLIVDERCEIANCFNGVNLLKTGNFSDILSGASKEFAFESGIRALRPDIIATDELCSYNDFEAVQKAKTAGVMVIASIHGKNIESLKQMKDFSTLLESKTFDRYVVLSNLKGVGTIEGVYDENLRLIYSF